MKKVRLSTTHYILIGFLCAILIGSILLYLPISSASGKSVSYIDALFTAATSTCVTGLVTVTTASAWSIFGQAVILLLIQIGGLGVITVMSSIMLTIGKKMGLQDRMLIMDSFNLSSMAGLSSFIKKVILGSLCIELLGALAYMTVFIPQFGAIGIWYSVFNSVSAFCNAGMDIISDSGLYGYVSNPIINITTSILIILGGLGFVVWWDIAKKIRGKGTRHFRNLTLHSKIAITSTAIFLIAGTFLIFIFEYNNPQTIGNMNLFNKIQASFFQSVTTRTAGFAFIPQEALTNPSSIICLLLMFIGGSPVGTAGGIKTVTFLVLIKTCTSVIRNKKDVSLFNRRLSEESVRKAVSVFTVSFFTVFLSTILLSAVSNASVLDILYETVSATATVGLSRNLTSTLNLLGKLIIIITMYFGRVGPISMAFAFMSKKQDENIISNPKEDISIG